MGDISFTQAQIENVPPKLKSETNFLCVDVLSVEQKADLTSSNRLSNQLYLPPFAFVQFYKRESNREAQKVLRGLICRRLRTR